MSELDDFNRFMRESDEYNRVQLRQTLELYTNLSELLGAIKKDPNDLTDFELGWLGIKDEEK